MSNEYRVRVTLYWGDDIIYESNTVRYSCDARSVIKLPLNGEHNAHYSEILILDNEFLQDFMVAPNTMQYMMNLDLLEMIEANAHANIHVSEGANHYDSDVSNDVYELDDMGNNDAPNDVYDSNEMGDSKCDKDDDLQPTDDVSQNTSFYGENIP
ncbi:hypothetical protein HAX54_049556 [Datura stramonium]|uniref:Uncharacterized protein n=1 Tax=Datura stramonium TaxID=4076 RepID=A0ABS8SVK6_DATST|nr:hypothetical protein [Datura stramonium]